MFFQELINRPLEAAVAFSCGLMFALAVRLGPTNFPPSFRRVPARCYGKSAHLEEVK